MKIEINLGKLLEFYDMCSENYDLTDGNGFRAFFLDFVCHGDREEDWYQREDSDGYSEDAKVESSTVNVFGDTCISIMYDTREAAEHVLLKLKDILCERNIVTVADYVRVSNQKPESRMYNLGWTKLNSAYVYSYNCTKEGKMLYGIHFPKVLPIEHGD